MGDRTTFQVYVYACPEDQREAAAMNGKARGSFQCVGRSHVDGHVTVDPRLEKFSVPVVAQQCNCSAPGIECASHHEVALCEAILRSSQRGRWEGLGPHKKERS